MNMTETIRTFLEFFGPVSGVVRLPLRMDWSERAEFHLDDSAERNVMYERVIREATRVDDLRSYLNEAVLQQVWRRLFLPARVRLSWEERFPDLGLGFLNRMSSDVDLFASAGAEFDFVHAVDVVVAAYQDEGIQVDTEIRTVSFARLNVACGGESAKVELGVDWRKNEPVQMALGPVLHADDAVANKVCALFGRAEVRDYVDVDAVLSSGRYTEEELLRLAADHDPGFDRLLYAEALTAIDRFPGTLFQPYGLTVDDVSALKDRMNGWAGRIRSVAT